MDDTKQENGPRNEALASLPPADGSALPDKWVAACIAYMVGQGIDRHLATSEAEAWIEDNPEDVDQSPEGIADDIMSYWID